MLAFESMSGTTREQGESFEFPLEDLNVWLLGSEELTEAITSVCWAWIPAPRADWATSLRERRPNFVLVEGVARLTALRRDRLDELLDICDAQEIPCFLWIVASPFDPEFLRLAPRFSRVFSMDLDHLPALREAGARSPARLWPGTATPDEADEPAGTVAPSADPVVWVESRQDGWPETWRRKVASILEGAGEHGLKIVAPEDPGLLGHLRHAKVAIATDPAGSTPGFAPRVAFDAMAHGTAVVTPHAFAAVFDFSLGGWRQSSWRELVSVATDRGTASSAIDLLLSDERLYDEMVETCRRIVAFNHTQAHRVATLASAAGVRLAPDVLSDPAHS